MGAAGGFASDTYNATIGQMQGGMAASSGATYMPDSNGGSHMHKKLSG